MSLFRNIFRGKSGGGSGGPTTADKVSMTPVPGVNAVDVQAGMSVVGSSLEKLFAQNVQFHNVDAPTDKTQPWAGEVHINNLPNGRYAIFTRSTYVNNYNENGAPTQRSFCLRIDKSSSGVKLTFTPTPNLTFNAQSDYATTNYQYWPNHFKIEGEGLTIANNDMYSEILFGWNPESRGFQQISFEMSDIINIDTFETLLVDSFAWTQGESRDGFNFFYGMSPYVVPQPYIPSSARRDYFNVPAGNVVNIENFITDSPVSVVVLTLRNRMTNNEFSVRLIKFFDKYYKTILKDTIGCDVAIYNASNNQTIPCISGFDNDGEYISDISYYGLSASYGKINPVSNIAGTKVADIPVFGGQSPILKTTDITADNIGTIVQYTGETKDGFVNGYFYKATGNIIDVPEQINIVPNTEGTSLEDPNKYILNQIEYYTSSKQNAIVYCRGDNVLSVGPQPYGNGDWFVINSEDVIANGIVVNATSENWFTYNYIAAHQISQNQKWEEIDVQTPGINNDASLYTLTSLSSLFQYSTAKLAKVYNEEKLPTTGAYTVLSLGWTYNDSNNMPALLAVELATGKLYYYHGTEANCKPSAWNEFNFGTGGGSSTDNNGLEGDYCARYGIVDETQSGLPIQGTGNRVIIPAQMVMDIPGVPGLTINSSQIVHDLTSTTNCELFLANGNIIEATDVFFQQEEPEDGNTGFAAWWNGTEWKFKSNDTGNVFRPANAVRIAKCIFTDGNLTRLCFTGCRLLNKQEYIAKNQKRVDIGDSGFGVGTYDSYEGEEGDGLAYYGQLAVQITDTQLLPRSNMEDLGDLNYKWEMIYVRKICNGANAIDVPSDSPVGGKMLVAVPPAEEGTFTLKATRAADGTITTTWVKDA